MKLYTHTHTHTHTPYYGMKCVACIPLTDSYVEALTPSSSNVTVFRDSTSEEVIKVKNNVIWMGPNRI